MPIYEYQCEECQHEFEALQKMSDEALKDCPECSESALVKKISAAAFRLSGSGWYETDFKSGNKKNLAGDADKSANKSGDSKGDSTKSSDSSNNSTPKASEKKAAAKSG
jgi:putative FmdB family regulatory protein